jgi:hypothetical protein
MGVFFNGRLIVSPATASVVNDDKMRNANLTVGNVVALIGKSLGGQPKTALRFGSPQEARDALIGGELLDAVLAAFDPSSETNGPSQVIGVRVNPAVQAAGVMKGAGNVDLIDLTASDYGQRGNGVRFKTEPGTNKGLRVTTQFGESYYSGDDVARDALSVHYTGAEASATVTINGTQLVLSAPAGTPVATIAFADAPTYSDLSDRINVVAGFAAEVLDGNYGKKTLQGLDFAAAVDCKAAAYTVKADLQAVVDWINGNSEGYVNAARKANVGLVPAVVGWTYLSGGSDGVSTFNDWADCFEVMQTIDAQWVTPVSADPALHAAADAHVAYMSNVGMKERRSICGMDLGTSMSEVMVAAKNLNSDRTSLVFQGHYDYGNDGKLALFPAYISAARIAGGFAGVNPGTPLTNKNFKCRGLERNLRNPTDTDVLIKAGVLCLEETEAGYKVVKSISTWLVNENYNRVEQSTGVALDFVARNVRKAVDALRGTKGNALALSRAKSITESTLRELARQEPQGPGVLAGDDENPAWRNVTVSLEGDVLRIQYECSPVIPINYVLNTIFAVPFSGAA